MKAEVKGFIIKAVNTRQKLIATGKSKATNASQQSLNYLKAYAEELKDSRKLANFFINNYTKILDVAPPTWNKKATEIYNNCQQLLKTA